MFFCNHAFLLRSPYPQGVGVALAGIAKIHRECIKLYRIALHTQSTDIYFNPHFYFLHLSVLTRQSTIGGAQRSMWWIYSKSIQKPLKIFCLCITMQKTLPLLRKWGAKLVSSL